MSRAPKIGRTSDVMRPRMLALAAIGGLAGAALAAPGVPIENERPIARPHAKVACASCHGEATDAPVTTCQSCHRGHASTRAGHRDLGCPTCHAQHAGAQGVTFEGPTTVRWGSSGEVALPRSSPIAKGTTVPLVSLATCARCHDLGRTADPISACIPAGADAGVSVCFDEHVRSSRRFVAWEAAREVASTTSWVGPAKREGLPWLPALAALTGALVFGAAGVVAERRKSRVEPAKPIVAAERKRLPVIDPSTCLGCYACVDACPFDVLAIEKYVAVVERPDECCGVILCEQVCPNGSLRVAEGEPILDRPATDEWLESRDVPGLFLAGDLTGLPLIKNAINQGTRVIDRIAARRPRRNAADVDVVVIGAGPAGLSAALRAKEKGLSCVVVEQATIAASIKSFPRDKIVHDPPLDLPIVGVLWLAEATKEEILAQWTRIVRTRGLDVREGRRVVDLARDGEGFVVRAEGESDELVLSARNVVLAIGRRGSPRRLDLRVEAGCDERIAYALADARSFAGKRVVIAGLGDSAMEAAIALARQPGTTVTIAYRGARFNRGKTKSIRELESLIAKHQVRLLFETVPVAVGRSGVTMAGGRVVPADALLVLVGGVPAWDLLTRAGIVRPDLGVR